MCHPTFYFSSVKELEDDLRNLKDTKQLQEENLEASKRKAQKKAATNQSKATEPSKEVRDLSAGVTNAKNFAASTAQGSGEMDQFTKVLTKHPVKKRKSKPSTIPTSTPTKKARKQQGKSEDGEETEKKKTEEEEE